MTVDDLPATEFGRLTTEDGFVIHRQGAGWLIWSEKYWPERMRTFNGPLLTNHSFRNGESWHVCEQASNGTFSSSYAQFDELDTALRYAKALVLFDIRKFEELCKTAMQTALKREVKREVCEIAMPARLIDI